MIHTVRCCSLSWLPHKNKLASLFAYTENIWREIFKASDLSGEWICGLTCQSTKPEAAETVCYFTVRYDMESKMQLLTVLLPIRVRVCELRTQKRNFLHCYTQYMSVYWAFIFIFISGIKDSFIFVLGPSPK